MVGGDNGVKGLFLIKNKNKNNERRERRREKERRREERAREKEARASAVAGAGAAVSSHEQGSIDVPPAGVEGHEGGEQEDVQGSSLPTPRSPERPKSQIQPQPMIAPPPPPSPRITVAIAKAIAAAAVREKHRANKHGPFTLTDFISDPELLMMLLEYLTFYDWCVLASVSREIRIVMVQKREIREEILERFLKTVGYQRWSWEDSEPLSLSLQVSSFVIDFLLNGRA